MKLITRRDKKNSAVYISANLYTLSADEFADHLLYSLNRKKERYSKVIAKLPKDHPYFLLVQRVIQRTDEQILEVESAIYEYHLKMNDRLEKGNL